MSPRTAASRLGRALPALPFLLLLGAGAPPPPASATLPELIGRIDAAQREVKTLQADFVQRNRVKLFKQELTSKGRLLYQRGPSSQLRWEYTAPDPSTMLLLGQKAYLQMPGRPAQVFDTSKDSTLRAIFTELELWLGNGSLAAAKDEGTVVVDLAKNQGPKVFHDLGYNGWWASTSTIKDKPELVARFAKSLEDSYCWFSKPENLDQVVALLQKTVKVPDLSDDAYKAMVKGLLPTFGPDITARTVDTWSKLLVDNKQLGAPKTRADVVAATARESFSCPR